MSVNADSFAAQCSVIASAALTRDRVLHFLPQKKKCYSLNLYVIDIKHPFQCNRLLYILKSVFLPNTWSGQQYQYLKHGGDNPVANRTITLGQVVTNFTAQVVTSCVYVVCARVCVCVCCNTIVVYTIPHRKLCTCVFILNENGFVIFTTDKIFLQNIVFSYIAEHYIKLLLSFN